MQSKPVVQITVLNILILLKATLIGFIQSILYAACSILSDQPIYDDQNGMLVQCLVILPLTQCYQ